VPDPLILPILYAAYTEEAEDGWEQDVARLRLGWGLSSVPQFARTLIVSRHVKTRIDSRCGADFEQRPEDVRQPPAHTPCLAR